MINTLLAMDPVTLAAFLGAGVLLNLTPGADVAFAVATGAQGGPRAGVAAAAGITLGSLGHTALAAFGLAAILAASPGALNVIRWIGAAYLLWLAWHSWNAGVDGTSGESHGARSLRRAFLRGTLTNLLNPKVVLFQLAFLPQFTDSALGPVWQQVLILGALFACTGFVITAAYGAMAGAFAGALRRNARLMNKISAIIFGGLAARLALT